MKTQLHLRADGSEIIPYAFEDHFVMVMRDKMSRYHNFCCETHWHSELEFIRVLTGKLILHINGVVFPVEEGHGIIINASRFHSLCTSNEAECEFLCAILSPTLLCGSSRLEQGFVRPFTIADAPDCFALDPQCPWQNDILDCITAIVGIENHDISPLLMQEHFFRMWNDLYQNALRDKNMPLNSGQKDQKQEALRKMTEFIKQNYREKLTLDDIAKAGYISKNGCIELFKKHLKDTPINYLIRYRLSIGAGMLKKSQLSISAVAEAAGFSNPSYFTECFHKFYNCTPGEYRQGEDG